jgi:prepilin-type N-terminal cleavage/methylation domain-containing protein
LGDLFSKDILDYSVCNKGTENREKRIKKRNMTKNNKKAKNSSKKLFSFLFSLSTRKEGFTLIEFLVVIATLSVLTSMLVVYSRTSEMQIKLITEQAKIIGVILRSKSLALQVFKEKESPRAPCGYGVRFDIANRRYLIFKDNRDAQGKCLGNDKKYTDSNEELAGQVFVLPNGINFSEPSSSFDLLFVPPDPKIYFDGQLAATDKTITIKLDNISASIKVNRVGQVTTE